jgi:hypothetical protein
MREILKALDFLSWKSVQEIENETGINRTTILARLHYLRKKNVVEECILDFNRPDFGGAWRLLSNQSLERVRADA